MNLHERFFPNKDGQLETLPRKIIRHILTGDFDLETLKRGPGYIKKWIESRGVTEFELIPSPREKNYHGYPEITYTHYYVKIKRSGQNHLKKRGAEIFDFSSDCIMDVQVKPEITYIDEALVDFPSAIAAVTGPTAENGTPNNGFFIHPKNFTNNVSHEVKFQHTNPVGQRRGALAQTIDGELMFVQESEKWKMINSGFEDLQYMIGTSFYYLSSDTGGETEYTVGVNSNHSTVSCLVMAEHPDGKKLSYVTLNELSTRAHMKQLLDKHFFRIPYIALEMEYAGSGVLIKDINHPYNLTRVHSNVSYVQQRIDHYLIKRKSDTH